MTILRHGVRLTLRGVDALYGRVHGLQPVGPLLLVGQQHYRGPERGFEDGTHVVRGDLVGTLHFHNAAFAMLDGRNARAAALAFARSLKDSLDCLAMLAAHEERWRRISVYYAVSWLPAHGQRVGFVTAPCDDGMARRLLDGYFRVLVWAFAAAAESRHARIQPHHYWLTRRTLLQRRENSPATPCALVRR